MIDIEKYLKILKVISKKALEEEIDINYFNLDAFELINSLLIYQSRKKRLNTLIYFPDQSTKTKFYIPSIFIIATFDFINNYLDSSLNIKVGDILQRNGIRYEITSIDNEKTIITSAGKNKITETIFNKNDLKTFIITTASLRNTKVKTKFTNYREFFQRILNEENIYMPSKFKYKSVIVSDKSIISELRKYKINNKYIHKSFPFQYITKPGTVSDNLPIEPMMYIVSDYVTVREQLFEKNVNIRNIIFIGRNKYKDNHLAITEDLNNNKFRNCLLIGSDDISINAIPNLHKWKWTLPELDYFNYFTTYPINNILVKSDQFTIALNDFDKSITQIEEEYGVNLKELYKYVRYILPIIIPSSKSRLPTQLDNLLIYFKKEGEDIVETALDEIGEYDYDDIWYKILEKYSVLIDCKRSSYLKFKKINEFKKIDYLVVPKEFLEVWKEEMSSYKIKNIISFKDFNGLSVKNKIIAFLGFFGYSHLKSMMYNSNKINMILYSQEESHFKNCENRLKRETYNELKNSDRKVISDISFTETEQIENIDELINRLFNQDDEAKLNPDYTESFSINILRELTFENDTEQLELDENKTVLLKINQKERFEKVKNLKIGDKIRVYDNSSKEELYKVALEFDINGEFTKIEEFSNLWKEELKSFYNDFNSLSELFQTLVQNGLSIKNELTLSNWTRPESDVKFPQRRKDLLVIKKTINSELLDKNYNDILKYRTGYNSIMKSLGRKFSSEISDYIQNKRKGKLLKQFTVKQIQQFVDRNAKDRIIKTIKAIDYE